MKKIFTLIFILVSIGSCNLKKESESPNDIKTEDKHMEEPSTEVVEAETLKKESKKVSINQFFVIEEKTSSSISNILVTSNISSKNKDTLKIEDADPILKMYNSDLNRDGREELYLITQSAGSGTYGTIYGYGLTKNEMLVDIIVPEISQSDLSEDSVFYGYSGHDSIYVDNNRLFRQFPIFKPEDKNCCPTGGTKTIQYTLKSNKSFWRLEIK